MKQRNLRQILKRMLGGMLVLGLMAGCMPALKAQASEANTGGQTLR